MSAKQRATRISFGNTYGRGKSKADNQLRREMKRLAKSKK